jgi:hypothetical protein
MTEIQSKLTELFTFLREVARQKSPPKKRIDEHPRHFVLQNLPDHPTISLLRLSEEDESSDGEFLVIGRPELPPCPRPPSEIAEWLQPGWERESGSVSVQSERQSI